MAPTGLAELIELVRKGTISGKIAKKVLSTMFESGEAAGVIVEREGLAQISDAGALEALVEQALSGHPAQVEQYRQGKHNLLGFFVGQVMKASKGQANPAVVNQLLRAKLEEGT